MGAIKTTELSNGNIGLEITYGGMEAPFGGVDTSAPPAYIDPKCFTATDGFLVVNNQLVVTSLNPLATPTLWSGTSGVKFLKFGTFYNSLTGQLNYALGYIATSFGVLGTSPTGQNYVFYMTSWNPADITQFWDDTLPISLYDGYAIESNASLTLECVETAASTSSGGTGAAGNITSVIPNGQVTGLDFSVSAGTGYGVGDAIFITQLPYNPGPPAYAGCWIKVLTTGVGGSIATYSIVNAGALYTLDAWTAGPTTVASDTILKVIGPSGTYTWTFSDWTGPMSRQQVVAAMAVYASPDIVVTQSADGYSLIITSVVPGVGGNAITVQDISTNANPVLPPAFYFGGASVPRNLEGGQISEVATAPSNFTPPVSVALVGGTLYIANIGPMILKFSGPGLFTTSTLYNGVRVLRKFAGSLIGLGLENQLGVYTQNQDMIFAWTTAGALDTWAPVTPSGNVTGAGFAQLADIGDYLSGLIVTSATAFIIRSQGVSYATATGNASSPFNFAHIGLGDEGEGAQASNLICQYDQTGVYVGNSDVYQISGQLSSIGQKIKALLFYILQNGVLYSYGDINTADAAAIAIGGNRIPLFVFCVGGLSTGGLYPVDLLELFIYNSSNGSWMTTTFPALLRSLVTSPQLISMQVGVLATENILALSNELNTDLLVTAIQIGTQTMLLPPTPLAPIFYAIQEGVPNQNSLSNPAFITFPQEEVLFGRDITIDALYVALVADVSENVTVNFLINGTQYATLVLTPAVFNTMLGNPIERQIFCSTMGAGAFTAHSPQLQIAVPSIADTGTAQIRFTKITMFASCDPKQRPV